MSGKYNRNKRDGSKPVRTKRTAKNQKRFDKQTGYARRMLMRAFYFANV